MTERLAALAILLAVTHATASFDPPSSAADEPAWSPDGTRIAYLYDPIGLATPGPPELRVVRADGGDARTVVPVEATGKSARLGDPQWTATGDAIVFGSYALDTAVYRVGADGSGLVRLAAGASPRLARAAGVVFFAGDDGLGSVDIGGGTPKRYGFDVDELDVSRDGALVVFSRGGDLHLFDVHTGNVRQLTRTSEQEIVPKFSPDAGRIAYKRGRAFYVLSLPGGGVRRVARIAMNVGHPSPPAWSPDGREVALSAFRLVIANADGSRARRATHLFGTGVFGTSRESAPAWSPDGRRILFASSPPCQDDDDKLSVVPRAGGIVRYLRDDCMRLGTQHADRLTGSAGANFILGRGGDDRISTGAGEDVAFGGAGDDTIVGGPGKGQCVAECDRLEGEAGDDTLIAGDTWSSLDGGAGADRLLDGAGADFLVGGPGADTISGGGGDDIVKARDAFRDRIDCGGGRDFVLADRQDVVARDCERVARPRRR